MGNGGTRWLLTPPSPEDGDTSPSRHPRRGGNCVSLRPDPLYIRPMTASTQAAAQTASASILRRYYIAMAAPFVVDLVSLIAYVAINRAPQTLASLVTVSAPFFLVATAIPSYFLLLPT